MKYSILSQIKGRVRLDLVGQRRLSDEETWQIQNALANTPGVLHVHVYRRIGEVAIGFEPNMRKDVLKAFAAFSYLPAEALAESANVSGIAMNQVYKERLVNATILHFACKLLPYPLRMVKNTIVAVPFIWAGLRSLKQRKLDVAVLDATAISIFLLQGDASSASSVMYLLGMGEILEEWTHKKTLDDLAQSMALEVDGVWLWEDGVEREVPLSQVKAGDILSIRQGHLVPLDGIVTEGLAMINQAALTGESEPVEKGVGKSVFAGTALEEGDIKMRVTSDVGNSRYDRIVQMIEASEKLKSDAQCRAEHLADRLVPISFAGAILTYLLTRQANRALSFLMVDFSCALKLGTPLAVLSAMKEAARHKTVVKGSKFLEACAEADTIVFDKTGTLTEASPQVVDVISFNGEDTNELLRVAACLEEHYPHSVATAVCNKARELGLHHEEMHAEPEYLIAHGIASSIDGRRIVLGSRHFIFDDEKIPLSEADKARIERIPEHYSVLYMARDGALAAAICLVDPIRKEAYETIRALKARGLRTVMMTGDSKHTAQAVAKALDLDDFYAEVLPADKADFVEKERQAGRTVLMIGDGINDSPALSAAHCGIAMQDGSSLAQQISDVTIASNHLGALVTLVDLSRALMKRIDHNYQFVKYFNGTLIGLGVAGVLMPSQNALLHNGSTFWLALHSMTPLLKEA